MKWLCDGTDKRQRRLEKFLFIAISVFLKPLAIVISPEVRQKTKRAGWKTGKRWIHMLGLVVAIQVRLLLT